MSVIGRNPSVKYAASEGHRFAADTTLVVVSCATCGVTYAIPESFNVSAKKYRGDEPNGWDIVCPFGHVWHYIGETEAERLMRLLDNSRDVSASLRARLDQTEASLRGTKANAARTRKELRATKQRIEHGVCPCCNRTFKQLARHMKAKHPDFAGAA